MDLQVLIPKATEVGRNQQINDQQLTNSHGIVTEDFKKMKEIKISNKAHLKGSYKKMKKMKLILLNLLLIVIEGSISILEHSRF